MLTILSLSTAEAHAYLLELMQLLQNSVDSGASVGFLPPLAESEARAYWEGIIPDLERGSRILLVALQDGSLVGTAQLELAMRPNGRHRAEVAKVLVHSSARRQGVGLALMDAIEDAARSAGRSLLFLDTRRGDSGEPLYQSCGYSVAGIIPRFALNANGQRDDTVFYYKEL